MRRPCWPQRSCPKEDRSAVLELDGEGSQAPERRRAHEPRRGERHVEEPLQRQVPRSRTPGHTWIPPRSKQLSVESFDIPAQPLGPVAILHERAGTLAHAAGAVSVSEQAQDRPGHGLGISSRDEVTDLPVLDQIGEPPHPGRHNRTARGHRLDG